MNQFNALVNLILNEQIFGKTSRNKQQDPNIKKLFDLIRTKKYEEAKNAANNLNFETDAKNNLLLKIDQLSRDQITEGDIIRFILNTTNPSTAYQSKTYNQNTPPKSVFLPILVKIKNDPELINDVNKAITFTIKYMDHSLKNNTRVMNDELYYRIVTEIESKKNIQSLLQYLRSLIYAYNTKVGRY